MRRTSSGETICSGRRGPTRRVSAWVTEPPWGRGGRAPARCRRPRDETLRNVGRGHGAHQGVVADGELDGLARAQLARRDEHAHVARHAGDPGAVEQRTQARRLAVAAPESHQRMPGGLIGQGGVGDVAEGVEAGGAGRRRRLEERLQDGRAEHGVEALEALERRARHEVVAVERAAARADLGAKAGLEGGEVLQAAGAAERQQRSVERDRVGDCGEHVLGGAEAARRWGAGPTGRRS